MPSAADMAPWGVIVTLLGGVGLFLLGMGLLTEGSGSLGGTHLRTMLRALTGNPLHCVAVGAAMTALMQASSATVLSTMGFVAAGMLSLSASVGLVVGATIGTSSTSWLVSLVGMGSATAMLAMPVLFAGAMLRILGRGKARQLGTLLAGLAVLLASIAFIGKGLSGTIGGLDLHEWGADTLTGKAALAGAGVAMAFAMQSSAAPIAISMVGVNAGSLSMEQACFLLLGATVGTTSTGGFVTLAAGRPARRVAIVWLVVSVAQALAGALLFPWLSIAAHAIARPAAEVANPSAVALAAFHTLFTVTAGVPLALLSRPISSAVTRMLPTPPDQETDFELEPGVLRVPGAAVAAARRGVVEVGLQVARVAHRLLDVGRADVVELSLHRSGARLDALLAAVSAIRVPEGDQRSLAEQVQTLEAAEHLRRMAGDMRVIAASEAQLADFPELEGIRRDTCGALLLLVDWLQASDAPAPAAALRAAARSIEATRKSLRQSAFARAAAMERSSERMLAELELIRQMQRIASHAAKMAAHLSANPPPPAPRSESSGD